MEYYIFIGGSIKDYDNDWKKYIKYLESNLNFYSAFIETRYEENQTYTTLLKR